MTTRCDYVESSCGHMDAGIRELKSRLSEFVSQAAAGNEVTVTDRGRPVARLVPIRSETDLERGLAEGWVDGPRRRGLSAVVLADDRG